MLAGNMVAIDDVKQYLPLLIPLVILQFGLLIYALWHVNTHTEYQRGTRLIWNIVVLVGMEFVGPILYFVLGKAEE